MASYSTHSLCKILPSGGQKISAKGNRYYMQPIEVFSHIDERGQIQFIKENFYLEQPLQECYAIVRFENNPKGPPQLTLTYKIRPDEYQLYVNFFMKGISALQNPDSQATAPKGNGKKDEGDEVLFSNSSYEETESLLGRLA